MLYIQFCDCKLALKTSVRLLKTLHEVRRRNVVVDAIDGVLHGSKYFVAFAVFLERQELLGVAHGPGGHGGVGGARVGGDHAFFVLAEAETFSVELDVLQVE